MPQGQLCVKDICLSFLKMGLAKNWVELLERHMLAIIWAKNGITYSLLVMLLMGFFDPKQVRNINSDAQNEPWGPSKTRFLQYFKTGVVR